MTNKDFENCAATLRGFCSVDLCRKYILDIANQLSDGNTTAKIDLNHVVITDNKFTLITTETVSEAENVWLLAACAMELINGSPIYNGLGEKAQHKETPLPRLTLDNADSLNKLLLKCLNFDRAGRPTMAEIAIEVKAIKPISHSRKRREAPNVAAQVNSNDIDKHWPEKMIVGIRRATLCTIFAIIGCCISFGQTFIANYDEPVTQSLLEAVLLLRSKTSTNVSNAQEKLKSKIKLFTMMDELKDKANDCMPATGQRFGVNVLVNELKRGQRVQSSDKELLDGADSRFSYSLYEKGVKRGATATYTLSGRSGQQCFVIVPYSANQSYNTTLQIGNTKTIPPTGKDSNGATYYIISAADGPKTGEMITLRIHNKNTTADASFVVINHNYRK